MSKLLKSSKYYHDVECICSSFKDKTMMASSRLEATPFCPIRLFETISVLNGVSSIREEGKINTRHLPDVCNAVD